VPAWLLQDAIDILVYESALTKVKLRRPINCIANVGGDGEQGLRSVSGAVECGCLADAKE
jgi:hypothetical protein